MSASLRKGWCPGALRPMAAKDGLLVRLRVTGGIVGAPVARAVADLGARHGNGLFDLSARGNLQMRGVSEDTLPALQDGLRDCGLLDDDAAGEAVRNVIASPLAGLHGGLDIRPLTAALEARLAGDRALHTLPSKFGFLIDDGCEPSLASVSSDVRFDWNASRGTFAIGLGGTRRLAPVIGEYGVDGFVEAAVRVAQGAIRLAGRSTGTATGRMRGLIDEFGLDVVARECGGAGCSGVDAPTIETHVGDIVGPQRFVGLPTLGLGVPFGRLEAPMLTRVADLAERALGQVRLTPWRAVLVPGVSAESGRLAPLRAAGFIVDADDPRLAVAACVGAAGCARGSTATHADATALARLAAAVPSAGPSLHVSGCEKGCAKASASRITLVGRGGRYDLVRDGRAGDPPIRRGLSLDDARAALTAMLEPA